MARSAARHVFVYGTLRRGGARDITGLGPPTAVFVGMATLRGTLYDLGAYPGLRLDGTALVLGEVYRIEPALERMLDQVEEIVAGESSEYFKRHVPVTLEDRVLPCLVYEVNPRRIPGRPVIAGGDWLAHRASGSH